MFSNQLCYDPIVAIFVESFSFLEVESVLLITAFWFVKFRPSLIKIRVILSLKMKTLGGRTPVCFKILTKVLVALAVIYLVVVITGSILNVTQVYMGFAAAFVAIINAFFIFFAGIPIQKELTNKKMVLAEDKYFKTQNVCMLCLGSYGFAWLFIGIAFAIRNPYEYGAEWLIWHGILGIGDFGSCSVMFLVSQHFYRQNMICSILTTSTKGSSSQGSSAAKGSKFAKQNSPVVENHVSESDVLVSSTEDNGDNEEEDKDKNIENEDHVSSTEDNDNEEEDNDEDGNNKV
jgi:hypothetical protein